MREIGRGGRARGREREIRGRGRGKEWEIVLSVCEFAFFFSSHQTGWTALIARCVDKVAEVSSLYHPLTHQYILHYDYV